ncbi:MAG: thermonuclease family protein [Bosea sp. (in: a-proteobacteria)]
MPRSVDLVVTLGIIGLLALGAAVFQLKLRAAPEITGFGEAIDGDSIKLSGEEIRLKGLDAPEYLQTCKHPDGRELQGGRNARRHLAALLKAGPMTCAIEGRDRYQRGLGRCRIGDRDLNAQMVRDGQAVAYGDFDREEREARTARRGIWALTFDKPADWRLKHAGEHQRR